MQQLTQRPVFWLGGSCQPFEIKCQQVRDCRSTIGEFLHVSPSILMFWAAVERLIRPAESEPPQYGLFDRHKSPAS